MKIIELQAENFKKLRAVHITPEGAVVTIGGDNGAGKTSCLDAIAAAIGGEKLCPAVPIRTGAASARVQVDLGDLIVERRWTANDRSTVVVKSKEGAKYGSPQTMLDGLVGRLSFDPLAFMKAPPKQQAETLRQLVGVDFTELDGKRRAAFDDRTVVNREIASLKGAIERMPDPFAPDEPVSVEDLLAEQEKLVQVQRQNDAERAQLATLKDRFAAAQARIAATQERVNKLEDQLANERKQLAVDEEAKAALGAEGKKARAVVDKLVDPDLGGIRTRLAEVEATNAAVRAKAQRRAEMERLAKKEKESADFSITIEAIDTAKKAALEEAKFPVAGLAFTEEGLTLNGIPLEQASGAEQLRVSLAMGLALNPKLKVLLIRDGSLLDKKSLAMVGEMAEKAGAQVWLEMVSAEKGVGVVIEDGMVAGAEAPVPVKPAKSARVGASR